MSNGFPIIAGEQNFVSQTTQLFAQAPSDNFSGTIVAYVGAPINEPLESLQNVYGLVAWGNGDGGGVTGWGGSVRSGGPGPGVIGAGGTFAYSGQTSPGGSSISAVAQEGGDGVVGLGGGASAPYLYLSGDNVLSGTGVVGFGGSGAVGFDLPNPDGPKLPGSAYTPYPGGTGVFGQGGDGSGSDLGGLEPGPLPSNATNIQITNSGVGVIGQGGYASGVGQAEQGSGVVGFSIDESGIGCPNYVYAGSGVAGVGGLFGVYGFSGAGFGVAGESVGVNPAILGVNLKSGGVATSGATAIRGVGPLGGLGIVGEVPASSTVNTTGAAIFGQVNGTPPNSDGPPWAGLFGGPVQVVGPVMITGALMVGGDLTVMGPNKSAAVAFPDGSRRQLYCMESPECWFEDFGEAKLTKGKAQIKLLRDFAAVIKTDSYHVFLTAYGRSNGLYVSKRTRQGFVVEEQGGGKSNLNFSFRIVGRRKDVKAERFAKVSLQKISKLPELPPLPKHTDGKHKLPPKPQKPIIPKPPAAVASITPPRT